MLRCLRSADGTFELRALQSRFQKLPLLDLLQLVVAYDISQSHVTLTDPVLGLQTATWAHLHQLGLIMLEPGGLADKVCPRSLIVPLSKRVCR